VKRGAIEVGTAVPTRDDSPVRRVQRDTQRRAATLGAVPGDVLGTAVRTDEPDTASAPVQPEGPVVTLRARHGKPDVAGVPGGTHRHCDERPVRVVAPRVELAGSESDDLPVTDGDRAVERLERRFTFDDDEHLLLIHVGVERGKPRRERSGSD